MRFSRGPNWFQRVFTGVGLPSELSAVIIPTVDAFGSGRFPEMVAEHVGAVGAGAIPTLTASTVPADKLRYVLFASLLQDDTSSIRPKLYIGHPNTIGGSALPTLVQIANAQATGGDATSLAAMARSFYMPPRTFLQGTFGLALPIGKVASLDYIFVDLPVGEYLPTT